MEDFASCNEIYGSYSGPGDHEYDLQTLYIQIDLIYEKMLNFAIIKKDDFFDDSEFNWIKGLIKFRCTLNSLKVETIESFDRLFIFDRDWYQKYKSKADLIIKDPSYALSYINMGFPIKLINGIDPNSVYKIVHFPLNIKYKEKTLYTFYTQNLDEVEAILRNFTSTLKYNHNLRIVSE